MAHKQTPIAYRPAQIILHWVVVVGIMMQFALNDAIARVKDAQTHGGLPQDIDMLYAWLHVGVGTGILIAVLGRLYLRYRYGAPAHAKGTSPMQAKIATAVHWALYGLLLAMVVTGMISWNGITALGDMHFYIGTVLFFLIVAHAAAALFNQFVRKDGTLARMMISRRAK